MPLQRRLLGYRLLKVTTKYQRLYPEGTLGRIDLKRRPAYLKEIAKVLIKDKRLSEILSKASLTDTERINGLVSAALARAKGDRPAAKAFLGKLISQIPSTEIFADRAIRRKARAGKIAEGDLVRYAEETRHLYESVGRILIKYLTLAQRAL